MIRRYVNKDYENVVCGDFNCTLNPLTDRLNCTGLNDVGNRELLEICTNSILKMSVGAGTQKKRCFPGAEE